MATIQDPELTVWGTMISKTFLWLRTSYSNVSVMQQLSITVKYTMMLTKTKLSSCGLKISLYPYIRWNKITSVFP